MQSCLNISLDCPLTDEQMQFCADNTSVILIELVYLNHWLSLCIALMHDDDSLTAHHCFILLMYSTSLALPPRDNNTKPLSLLLTPRLHVSHIWLLTPCALDTMQTLCHTCYVSAGCGFRLPRLFFTVDIYDGEWRNGTSLLPHSCCAHSFNFIHLVIRLRCPH